MRLSAYFFFSGAPVREPAPGAAKGEAGVAGTCLGCFGFLCSRLLRCCPFGIFLSPDYGRGRAVVQAAEIQPLRGKSA
jgi:hypothetical protein